jgi:hypothetical protein
MMLVIFIYAVRVVALVFEGFELSEDLFMLSP